MAALASTPLILFSGLAADDHVFRPQKAEFPQLIVPEWPHPQTTDTMASYCDRIADNLRMYDDAIIGGASFGGIIALHVAQCLRPRAVVLIGSVRYPAELSWAIRYCRPLKRLVPLIPVRLLQFCCAPFASTLARNCLPLWCELAQQFRGSDPSLFKWSVARLLDWSVAPQVDCPVYHIHGDRDHVLPLRYTQPTNIVTGGGHVISLTHPSEVNDFIRFVINQTSCI